MSEHVTPKELEGALGGDFPPGRIREVVRHLIRGCETCQEGTRQGLLLQARKPVPPGAYDAAFESAADFASRVQRLPPDEQPRFLEALSLLSAGRDVFALAWEGDMTLSGLGVYEALLAQSWAVRYRSPTEMCHLAKVAVEMAKGFEPQVYGERQVADLQARAWGELANAYRVATKLQDAKLAFGWAFARLERGTGDSSLKARLLTLQACWWGDSRHFEMALRTLDIVPALYHEAGESHLAARALIAKALFTFYSGDIEEAIRLNREGLAVVDQEREPSLVSLAIFNTFLFLVYSEKFVPANRLLFENRARFQSFEGTSALKLRAIEGLLSYGLGHLESAQIAFRAAIDGFKVLGQDFACALVTLYLAMTLLRQNRFAEAEAEVLAAHQVFVALHTHHEVLAATVVLKESFRLRNITLELLEGTVRYLRKKQIELGL